MKRGNIDRGLLEELRKRIEELERELALLKKVYSALTGSGNEEEPVERAEEIKVRRKRIAWLYEGEDYVKLVPEFDMVVEDYLQDYLEETVEDIRRKQEREGIDPDEQAQLVIVENDDNTVAELWIRGIYGIADSIKARTALKYAVVLAWDLRKEEQEKGEKT